MITRYLLSAALLCYPAAQAEEAIQRSSTGVVLPAAVSAQATLATENALAGAIETIVTDDTFRQALDDAWEAGAGEAVGLAYAEQLYRPIWTPSGARQFEAMFDDMASHGIAARASDRRDLQQLVEQRFSGTSPKRQAIADVDLTIAWVDLLSHVSAGLGDEGQMASSATDRPVHSQLVKSVRDAGQGKIERSISPFIPSNPQYERLQETLKTYRQIEEDGGWEALDVGPIVKPGDRHAVISPLRTRLAKEGFLDRQHDNGSPLLDRPLRSALIAAQAQHGIDEDGVFGPETARALNEPVESKIARLADSLYRWRELGDLGDKYVWANIPSFRAEGWKNRRKEISMRAIMGQPDRPTPTFSDKVDYIVANPKWYVPSSIMQRDKLPKLQRDPGYAARGEYTVIDKTTGEAVSPYEVDWFADDVTARYRLVQGAGKGNALGRIKIIFPNQYSVYLHDTPTKSLFDHATRAFSSGCVRLEHPQEMAEWIARTNGQEKVDQIEMALRDKETERVELSAELPVHITYMTVTVDEAGTPTFWRDIYNKGQDEQLVAMEAPFFELSTGKVAKISTQKKG
ncbi:hypothetical protein PB2503_02927 [Parvularcula bermudensis HTCC2503]|uniref:L,D-TPase catalytic domain-containing protein n=1 Tax=Parvularcula bermudensis (strain ATCC BAA-594 / HTCC2503 / KCTC 12087) TaxID=314260 RepID=E0TD03_PARBH|nr:L,D-transpeptidase family protein [Parvularcula bermudensis]ADM08662.1 hypothetical protein PB2503_02927 [Parvularcula bermudensis HTCC2503]